MVFFAVEKFVSLIRSHLFISVFISLALGNEQKKALVQFMSKNVLAVKRSHVFCSYFLKLFSFQKPIT